MLALKWDKADFDRNHRIYFWEIFLLNSNTYVYSMCAYFRLRFTRLKDYPCNDEITYMRITLLQSHVPSLISLGL